MYDDKLVFFALAIPGDYRFNSAASELCAKIVVMLKIGSNATFVNMGGCPDASSGCSSGVPSTCDDYRVNIGAEWELSITVQRVTYPINVVSGTGDDPVAQKLDAYGVSPVCQMIDDGVGAGNEWAGSWAHSNPTTEQSGTTFEISRLLTTKSSTTDAQLSIGGTFGIAFWDPFQTEAGWINTGHYLTGCANRWMDLVLVGSNVTSSPAPSPSGTSSPIRSLSGTRSETPSAATVVPTPFVTCSLVPSSPGTGSGAPSTGSFPRTREISTTSPRVGAYAGVILLTSTLLFVGL